MKGALACAHLRLSSFPSLWLLVLHELGWRWITPMRSGRAASVVHWCRVGHDSGIGSSHISASRCAPKKPRDNRNLTSWRDALMRCGTRLSAWSDPRAWSFRTAALAGGRLADRHAQRPARGLESARMILCGCEFGLLAARAGRSARIGCAQFAHVAHVNAWTVFIRDQLLTAEFLEDS